MAGKTVLVTGGAGFLGSHLCDRLIEDGNNVLCLDNLFTGSKDNILHLLANPKFEFIRHDVVDPILLEAHQVYNLACPASPVHYQYNPVKTVQTSVMGAINMLGLAKRTGARILQASTSEVYGDPIEHPQTESYWGHVNPIGIRSCYDEGKRVAETLMMDYHREDREKQRQPDSQAHAPARPAGAGSQPRQPAAAHGTASRYPAPRTVSIATSSGQGTLRRR